MNSNFVTENNQLIKETDGLYGNGRLSYSVKATLLAGRIEVYDAGTLKPQNIKSISYDVAQKFPDDKLTAVLQASMTELPQVNATESSFEYYKYAEGVEFIYSSLNKASQSQVSNVKASTLNELMKKWDFLTFNGWKPNQGFVGHPKASKISLGAVTVGAELVNKIVGQVTAIKDKFSIGYTDVTIGLPSALVTLLSTLDTTGTPTAYRTLLEQQLPGVAFVEMNTNVGLDVATFLVIAKPLVTLHMGSLPAQYAQEVTNYGLSNGTLFTMESTAVELELDGAIVEAKLA